MNSLIHTYTQFATLVFVLRRDIEFNSKGNFLIITKLIYLILYNLDF